MEYTQHICLFFLASLVTFCSTSQNNTTTDDKTVTFASIPSNGFTSLLNGKDLAGWHTVTDGNGPDSLALFTFENGAIHAYPNQIGGSLQSFAGLVTDKEYGSYHLTFEFRGARASTKVEASEHYDPKGELRTKGELENKYHRFSRFYSWEVPGWNKVEVEVNGDHATFTINGKLVNEAIDMKYWDADMESWQPLTKGKILLQAEGAEIFYRNVFIKTL